MKRFTETTKWDDPWFFELSPVAKLLWFFLCDHCDCAGIVDFSFRIASAKIGAPVKEQHLTELQSRLNTLEGGKILVRGFIRFQYGSLSRDCKPHTAVFSALSRHGLEIDSFTWEVKGLTKGYLTLQEKEKKGKGKEGDSKGGRVRVQDSTEIPEPLIHSPEFVLAWAKWLQHLKEKRKPATIHAQDLQLNKLKNMGIVKALATLNHCIEKNWQGIYEQEDRNGATPPPKPELRNSYGGIMPPLH